MALRAAASIDCIALPNKFCVASNRLRIETRQPIASAVLLQWPVLKRTSLPFQPSVLGRVQRSRAAGSFCGRSSQKTKAVLRDEVSRVDRKSGPPEAPPAHEPLHAKENKLVVEERLLNGQIRR
jgi:hypothetical protein